MAPKSPAEGDPMNTVLCTSENAAQWESAVPEDMDVHDVDAARAARVARVEVAGGVSHTGDFVLPKDATYAQQYSHIYFSRLNMLRKVVEARARGLWGTARPDGRSITYLDKLLNVHTGQCSVIVGTLFKVMPQRPNILEEYAREIGMPPPEERATFTSDADELLLEDETGRVQLHGAPELVARMVTGVIVAVLGTQDDESRFVVEGVCECGPAPQPVAAPRALLGDAPTGSDPLVLLVSGLNYGDARANPLAHELLVEWLTGHLGSGDEVATAARVAHIVVLGGSLCGVDATEHADAESAVAHTRSAHNSPTRELDAALSQLLASVPVTVLPGASDPANLLMPQQRLNACLVPLASRFHTFTAGTNPQRMHVGDVELLCTAGQNVDDFTRCAHVPDALDRIESTLRWRHVCPTAPDTLPTYPFGLTDPFVLKASPHVYAVGNQGAFATRLVRDTDSSGGDVATRLIAVPSFAATHTAVLLNARTLTATPLSFDV